MSIPKITKDDLVELAKHLELGMGKVDISNGVIALVNFFYAAGYVRGAKESIEAVIKTTENI